MLDMEKDLAKPVPCDRMVTNPYLMNRMGYYSLWRSK